jgi:hypothetical protein
VTVDDATFVSKAPSVKYRGIFLNDEDWGLQQWAAKTYDPAKGNYGFVAMRAVRIGGAVTILALVGFVFVSIRRDQKAIGQ